MEYDQVKWNPVIFLESQMTQWRFKIMSGCPKKAWYPLSTTVLMQYSWIVYNLYLAAKLTLLKKKRWNILCFTENRQGKAVISHFFLKFSYSSETDIYCVSSPVSEQSNRIPTSAFFNLCSVFLFIQLYKDFSDKEIYT